MSPALRSVRFVLLFCAGVVSAALPHHRLWAQETPLSPVVQVAVNYAPGKSTMISGFVVAEGRFVLTQASTLDGAYDIAVAFSNSEVLDPVMEHVDERFNVALLRLPGPVKAWLSAASTLPAGETAATVLGAPEAFLVGKASVRLTPIPGLRRWRITPGIPPAFRGAPIVNTAGELLGIAVEEPKGAAVVGVPVSEFLPMVSGRSGAFGATPATPAPAPAPVPVERAAVATELGRPLASLVNARLIAALEPRVQLRLPPEPARGKAAEPASKPVAAAAAMPAAPRHPAAATPTPVASAPIKTGAPAAVPATTSAPRTTAGLASGSLENMAAWEARIRSEPENIDLRFSYADTLLSAGQFLRAVELLEQAQARFPAVPRVYWHLAHAYWQRSMHKDDGSHRRSMEKKSYLKARVAFETFLRMAPQDSRAAEARLRLKLLREADFGRY